MGNAVLLGILFRVHARLARKAVNTSVTSLLGLHAGPPMLVPSALLIQKSLHLPLVHLHTFDDSKPRCVSKHPPSAEVGVQGGVRAPVHRA